jgi:hypothetical protein
VRIGIRVGMIVLGACMDLAAAPAPLPVLPIVETEEALYACEPANNGAGPLWCYGSTCLVRIGPDLFASGLETLTGRKPLNNCRWLLFHRTAQGWKQVQADPRDQTREPCPLAGFPDGRLFLSANPTLSAPDAHGGPSQPQVLQFSARHPSSPFTVMVPPWEGEPAFTEHSYRGFAADGLRRELILFNILGHDGYHWSFMDRAGKWSRQGKLEFPFGAEYETPEPIRLCYPEIVLRDRAVHVLGISDIVEPVKAWRDAKLALNHGRTWDYDFRRLFYAWTPDLTTMPFSPWIEVASRESTAGHITNLDLWLDKAGRAHLLWLDQSIGDVRLRERFFPGVPLSYSLEYAIINKGRIEHRTTLVHGGEGLSPEIPGFARLHATPDGRLFVFYFCGGTDDTGHPVSENRILELHSDGTPGTPVPVPLDHPFTRFMTATERGGSPPSNTLDLLGEAVDRAGISSARLTVLNSLRADFTVTVQRLATGSRLTLDGRTSRSATGAITAWSWRIDGKPADGAGVERLIDHGGPVPVTLLVKDNQGQTHRTARTVALPPSASDFGLRQWGLVLRTEALSFTAEGGGHAAIQNGRRSAPGFSLARWTDKKHWIEWDVDLPVADDYFLLARYATAADASRGVTLDDSPLPPLRCPASGGYGSDLKDQWAFAMLMDDRGQPVPLRLSSGRHRLRLENRDGNDLSLDYFEWVARTAESPARPGSAAGGPAVRSDDDGPRYVVPRQGTLSPVRMNPDGGLCYTTPFGNDYPGDGLREGAPSALRLFENGKELGPAHAPHAGIRASGGGRYSHWKTLLYFSASDGSDPRTNGCVYTWTIQPP